MRRRDREVTDINEIEKIIAKCRTCHVAMIGGEYPYVVPLSYGYKITGGDTIELYFHCAMEGKKIDILKRNNKVCFEISYEGEATGSDTPCNSGYYFASVVGFGEAAFIDDEKNKNDTLSILYKHQTGDDISFDAEQLKNVCIFKIVSKNFTGKKKLLVE